MRARLAHDIWVQQPAKQQYLRRHSFIHSVRSPCSIDSLILMLHVMCMRWFHPSSVVWTFVHGPSYTANQGSTHHCHTAQASAVDLDTNFIQSKQMRRVSSISVTCRPGMC